MQSQVKIFCCLALLVLGGVKGATQGDIDIWITLQTDKMQILEQSSAQGEVITSYIPFFTDLGNFFWSWDPKKEPKNTSPIYREPENQLNELMHNLFVDFDLSGTAHFRKVWFKPKPGLQFRGLLGIHDFSKKRPLIVLRMGIHGNVDEVIAERFLAKILYEDLDANFLILESLTSHAFLSTNKNISFGGVDEGLQTFVALKEIQKSKLSAFVKSYHLLSISMGGHGTFVTALMDQNNDHRISSILNLCPLINLKETIEHHEKEGLKATLVDLWNVRRLKALFDLYPEKTQLNEWWKSLFDLKPRFTPAAMLVLNESRRQPLLTVNELQMLFPKLKISKELADHLQNSKTLFDLNNFWPHYQGVKTPVTIYTTPNDPLVVNELNSEKIFRGLQPGDYKSLKYLRLERGIHCGLAPVYQWRYLVNIIREGLLL